MFDINNANNTITMNKGDFGIDFTINFDNGIGTSFVFAIKKANDTLIEKKFENISENFIKVSFTEKESALLDIGDYSWNLYQYNPKTLKNSLIVKRPFIVEKGV